MMMRIIVVVTVYICYVNSFMIISHHLCCHPKNSIKCMLRAGKSDVDASDRTRRRRQSSLKDWGVKYLTQHQPFPSSLEELSDDVFRAIGGTLCGLQKLGKLGGGGELSSRSQVDAWY